MKSARTMPKSVDQYLSSFPPATRRVLERVRGSIRRAMPRAVEAISYNIPVFKLDGRCVIYFAGWKEHYSIYPSNDRLVAAFKDDLAPYEVNGKGTIRFPLSEPVPVKLIAGIARFRAKEAAAPSTHKATSSTR